MLRAGKVESECLCAYAFATPELVYDLSQGEIVVSVNTDQVNGVYTGTPEFVVSRIYRYENGNTVSSNEIDVPFGSGSFVLGVIPLSEDATYVINTEVMFDDGSLTSIGSLIVVSGGEASFFSPLSESGLVSYDCPFLTYNVIPINSLNLDFDVSFVEVTGFGESDQDPIFNVLSESLEDTVELNVSEFPSFSSSGVTTARGFFGWLIYNLDLAQLPDLPSNQSGLNSPVYLGVQALACED